MFSDKELQTIQKAESEIRRAKIFQAMGLVVMVVLFGFFVSGNLSAETFAYALIAVVVASVIANNTVSPSYSELVQILVSKRATNE